MSEKSLPSYIFKAYFQSRVYCSGSLIASIVVAIVEEEVYLGGERLALGSAFLLMADASFLMASFYNPSSLEASVSPVIKPKRFALVGSIYLGPMPDLIIFAGGSI